MSGCQPGCPLPEPPLGTFPAATRAQAGERRQVTHLHTGQLAAQEAARAEAPGTPRAWACQRDARSSAVPPPPSLLRTVLNPEEGKPGDIRSTIL
jgi:hypothetical protein